MVAHLVNQAAMSTTTTLRVKGANNVELWAIAELEGNIVFTKVTWGVANFATNNFFTKQWPTVIDFDDFFFCNLRSLGFVGRADKAFCAGDKYTLQY
jgi:hypothetical protein